MANFSADPPISAGAIVEKLAEKCIGFHFSNEKAFGKTTHAYLVKTSPQGALLDKLARSGPRMGIYNIGSPAITHAEIIFLRMLHGHYQAKQSSLSLQVSATPAPIEPLVVLVKGSMANSVATVCNVRGVIKKTNSFSPIESDIIGVIISSSLRTGYDPSAGTAAHAIKYGESHSKLSRSATLHTFFETTGFKFSKAMASAIFNVWIAYVNIKDGFSDAGARFRDSMSRKLAQKAFEDSIYTALYTIRR